MKDVIEGAIKALASDVKSGMKPDDALKITQAMLNLAHVQGSRAANKLDEQATD